MSRGPAYWAKAYILEQPWLDGRLLNVHPQSITITPSPGVRLIPAHDGSIKVQGPYRGSTQPDAHVQYSWSVPILLNDEADWYTWKQAEAKGTWVYWTTGARRVDYFADAAVSDTPKLHRPLADGVVSGTIPAYVVRKNGTVSGTAATVSGQTVTVAEAGDITVEYTPVHKVVVVSIDESGDDFNLIRGTAQLVEVLAY